MSVTTLAKRQELRFLYLALAFALIVAFLVVLPPHGAADAAVGLVDVENGSTVGTSDWDDLTIDGGFGPGDLKVINDKNFSGSATVLTDLSSENVQSLCSNGTDTDDIVQNGTKFKDYPFPIVENNNATPAKNDICQTYLAYEVASNGDVILYIGVVRQGQGGSGPSGTTTVTVELNQVSHAQRQAEDLAIGFSFDGSDLVGQVELFRWDGSNWVVPLDGSGDPVNITLGGSAQAHFGEVAVNLSDQNILPPPVRTEDCIEYGAVAVYGWNGNSVNSNLNDWGGSASLGIRTCGKIVVDKIAENGGETEFRYTIEANEGTTFETIAGSITDITDEEDPHEWLVGPGSFDLSENTPPPPWSLQGIVCLKGGQPVDSDSILIGSPADIVTCTITNVAQTLKLTKEVIGGTNLASPGSWTLIASGTGVDTWDFSGSTGVSKTVGVGSYDLSESGPDGYSLSGWSCENGTLSGTRVTVAAGQDVSCEATNVADPASVSLVKIVSDLTGTVPWSFRFTLSPTYGVTGSATQVASGSGNGSSTELTWTGLTPGTQYTITETIPDGYEGFVECNIGSWDAKNSKYTFTPGVGGSIECVATNAAEQITVEVAKKVVESWPDDGFSFTLVSGQWSSTKIASSNNTKVAWMGLEPGSYSLSEDTSNPDYQHGELECELNEESVSMPMNLVLGDSVVCTAENKEKPTLKLVKAVIGGGSPGSWTLIASGTQVIEYTSGDEKYVTAGDFYTLSESGPAGYQEGEWGCTGTYKSFEDGVVELDYGHHATCQITNRAFASLTLVKNVSGGGSASASNWTLVAVGPAPGSSTAIVGDGGGTNAELVAGSYTLSEVGSVANYGNGTTWVCGYAGGGEFSGLEDDVVTLDWGEDVTCTITNTFNPPPQLPPPPPQFANVFVAKTDLVDPIQLDEDSPTGVIEYVITAGNRLTANIAATGVVVTDTLPPTTSFLSATPSKGTCAHAAGVVTCNVGTLAVGESMTINIRVSTQPLGSVTAVSVLNSVSIDVNETEDTSDNTDTETTAIVEVLPLEILPVTGAEGDRVALVAGLLLFVGTSMVLATRRREAWGN